ncbi:MAG: hypothetical protein QGI04_04525, partial [Candidatus Poseidoniia archaeon]|nr:hypothetical protein [Candidatus Poseidoniia archaeon]
MENIWLLFPTEEAVSLPSPTGVIAPATRPSVLHYSDNSTIFPCAEYKNRYANLLYSNGHRPNNSGYHS